MNSNIPSYIMGTPHAPFQLGKASNNEKGPSNKFAGALFGMSLP